MKSNDTIAIIEHDLTTDFAKEKYLELIISRMDESKRILNKTLFWLFLLAIAFFLISNSKIDGLSFPPFDKIDGRTILIFIPSIFSICYYYYCATWMNYIQQRQIYNHLTSLIFNIEVDSHLNDHIQPFNFLNILVKHNESENKNFLGYFTSWVMIPIAFLMLLSPFVFVIYSLYVNNNNLKLESWQVTLNFFVPILMLILLILMFIKSFRINILGKE